MNDDTYRGPRAVPDPEPLQTDSAESVETLLRRAGRRPPVPAADTAIVKQAARAQWQRTVRSQRRRRLWVGGGSLLAAAAALLLVINLDLWSGHTVPTSSNTPVATFEALYGNATVDGSAAQLEGTIYAGQTLATVPGTRAVLRLAGGPSLRLDVDSQIRFLSENQMQLEQGAVYIDSGDDFVGQLEVQTALGIARDIGTRFEVRLKTDAALSIKVRDGQVALERGKTEHIADAGTELTVSAGGQITETPIPGYGPLWQWTLAVLPAYDAEGRSLYDFLTWAANEGGWQLEFASDTVAERTREVILHGSIEGMGLDDATSMSLMSSGLDLDYRVQAGVLRVESR